MFHDSRNGHPPALTQREIDVLAFVCEGFTAKQIAKLLGVTSKTVEFHKGNISKKLGIRNVPALVKYAIKARIITAAEPQDWPAVSFATRASLQRPPTSIPADCSAGA